MAKQASQSGWTPLGAVGGPGFPPSVRLLPADRSVRRGDRSGLTGRAAELFGYLRANAGRPVSRDEILTQVWGMKPQGTCTRTIDMHIAKLRDRLCDDPKQPKQLYTVYGLGYMLKPDSRAA